MRGQASRPATESQALALAINSHPQWTKVIRDNRMTAAGWAALPPEIRAEAESAYESRFGMPMPPAQDGA